MAKTACEEAADPTETFKNGKAFAKRLRSEARELKAWRNTALDLLSNDPARWEKAKKACEQYAARIQKARKAKCSTS